MWALDKGSLTDENPLNPQQKLINPVLTTNEPSFDQSPGGPLRPLQRAHKPSELFRNPLKLDKTLINIFKTQKRDPKR